MFSVIIPTLWKSDKIKPLIQSLIDCELVNDIFIISNERNPIEDEYNHVKKVFVYSAKENFYVNYSWNWGVNCALMKNIAILNDDILIDTNVFSFLNDKLEDCGVIGMCFENYALKQSVSMNLTDVVERPYGFGCAMFIHKSNYVDIPFELKIACGDDYLITVSYTHLTLPTNREV